MTAPARGRERYTLVSFHAHPDDEALLTGGTLARAAAEGHRVVLVVATAGEAGLAEPLTAGASLGRRREEELAASAKALGCARVEVLGYPDSGSRGTPPPGSFAATAVEEPAQRLADLLREERADALTVYDPFGGYGHPDHVQVHRVGVRAAELAGTPVVLEATADRRLFHGGVRAYRAYQRLRNLARGRVRAGTVYALPEAYTAHDRLTHKVDVRRYANAKRAAMQAHATQASGGGDRTLAIILRLPRPLFQLSFGREWFVERGAVPSPDRRRRDDIFASLDGAHRAGFDGAHRAGLDGAHRAATPRGSSVGGIS